MSLGIARRLRAVLRQVRAVMRLTGVALDRRGELGWREIVDRAGRRLAGRPPAPEAASAALANQAPPPARTHFDAIYAIGYWPGEPKRYRVFNIAEGLREAGYAVHVLPFDDLDDIHRYRWTAQALVLFRAEYDPLVGIDGVLRYARATGMRVVYDIDDLVFGPTIVHRIDGLREMGKHQRRRFNAAIARQRRLLLECDLATVSTAPLARAVEALGRPSEVIPNSLNREQLRIADQIAATERRSDGVVRIGYFSGTRTHQRDFAVCEPALLEIMKRHHEVRFRLVGHLDLGRQWQRYHDRVERIGFLPPPELLRAIAGTDINLAPLELGNPFCEAKSELKFFEAAIVGVPTIATATEPFAAAIEDGISGLLVDDAPGWRRALDLLVSSEDRRRAMGAAAKQRALAR
ncbi:MAG TPA: glycosyltransferase, partial [Stellaceae bacterium]|nr:glycosyltransferase [Stellaceae bacterium]